MDLFHTQTCSTIRDLDKQHGITLTKKKGLLLEHVMTLKEESQYMTVMVKNVTADFSLTMDLSTSTMMQMRFLL